MRARGSIRLLVLVSCCCLPSLFWGQHRNTVEAELDPNSKVLSIQQEFVYKNSSQDTLAALYFNDWVHGYSNKNTALAQRFAEEYKKSLHLAKKDERGYTEILSMVDHNFRGIPWDRVDNTDLLELQLNSPLAPADSVSINITYYVHLPPDKFTGFGYGKDNNYYLNDWYLTPAVYDEDGHWNLYSNKNQDDLYTGPANTVVTLKYPELLYVATNFQKGLVTKTGNTNTVTLTGAQSKSCEVIITPENRFTTHFTEYGAVTTDIKVPKYDPIQEGISIEKVVRFLSSALGRYPNEVLLVSNKDYQDDPLYGLNLLPSFITPYEKEFQFEMMFLKTATNAILRESFFFNPRKEKWLIDAIQNYILVRFVELYYPDQTFLGKLSKIWGLRSFHLAQMGFNDQYALFYMVTARGNNDQPLDTPSDSLIKFNRKISKTYKAGLGLVYLADYIGEDKVDESIRRLYWLNKRKSVSPGDLKEILEASTSLDINWFFTNYVSSGKKIDYTISDAFKFGDSLEVTVKNKRGTNVPISLFGLEQDSVISKYWLADIATEKTFTIPSKGEDQLVLNYNQKIPEINQRDNWKSFKGSGTLIGNKKLKFQFFQDTEDPYYHQLFWVPVFSYNLYDGIVPGIRLHNKTFLRRPFIFDFSPSYSFKENSFVGSGKVQLRKFHEKGRLYTSSYSLGGSTYHFQTNSRYSKITPAVSFGWRPKNLLSDKRDFLSLRFVNVFRDIDPSLNLDTDPDYSVLNARFTHSAAGIIKHWTWFADAQYANDFSKLSFNMEYRQLYQNNTQLNLRIFAGAFLHNKTDSDYFSFALDRPTDYLFDYSFLGRSEDTGLWSQQIIIAEGGFKSKLPDPYANEWITTFNGSVSLWRWIEVYGDLGLIKNKGSNANFVYDSGIRLNLLTDYFELYFPVYSNLGWEVAQPNYGEKIRFVITLSPKTLTGLFRRQWF